MGEGLYTGKLVSIILIGSEHSFIPVNIIRVCSNIYNILPTDISFYTLRTSSLPTLVSLVCFDRASIFSILRSLIKAFVKQKGEGSRILVAIHLCRRRKTCCILYLFSSNFCHEIFLMPSSIERCRIIHCLCIRGSRFGSLT